MSNNTIKILVKKADVGKRLDILLNQSVDTLTRTRIKNLIKTKKVRVDKIEIISPAKKVKIGEMIELDFIVENPIYPKAQKIPLNIIFEDNDLLIINKPAGMVVHPGAGNFDNTLVNALVYKYKKKLSDINGSLRPGIVHRLDKDTSGALVIAKNNFSHSELGKQFSNHSIKRKYLALVWGVVRPLYGKISTLLSRSKKNRQLMAVSELRGKKAVTNYKTVKVFENKNIPKISLIEFYLETGRTHQIRAHLYYKNTSLLGDKKYKKKHIRFKNIPKDFEKKLSLLNGQALHAETLGFIHPVKGKIIRFNANLPLGFKNLLSFLEKVSD